MSVRTIHPAAIGAVVHVRPCSALRQEVHLSKLRRCICGG